MRNDSGAAFMGSTHSGPPSPLQAKTEDSTEEFNTASSGVGVSGLPSSWRHITGVPSAPVTTTARLEDAPATQAITIVPLWVLALQPDTSLPFE
jgi:hypothetical protein